MRRRIGVGIVLSVCAAAGSIASAQFIGPAFPLTGSPSFAFSGTGDTGLAGGRTFTYTGIDPTAYESLYWGPWDSTSVKMSLNSRTATSMLSLVGTPSGTSVNFENPSVAYASPGGPGAPASGNYVGRATVAVTGGATWVTPPAGVATQTVANLTGLSTYTANILFTSNATGSFTPIRTLPTTETTGVAASYSGGFFYVPRMRWASTGLGNWDTLGNWNHSTIAPYAASPVTIAATAGAAVVNGPSASLTQVKSIAIGGTDVMNVLQLSSANTLTVPGGITVARNGQLDGAGYVNAPVTVLTSGKLAVTSQLNVTGNVTVDGTTSFQLNNAISQPGMSVIGVFDAGGTLELTRSLDFNSATLGASRDIIVSSQPIVDRFANVTGVSISPTRSLAVVYQQAGVRVVVARPGDSDLDLDVDFDDLLSLARTYGVGSSRTWSQGDFDGSGMVDFDDLLILARSYGLPPAAFAAEFALAQSLVPEPTSSCIVGVAVSMLIARRRRIA